MKAAISLLLSLIFLPILGCQASPSAPEERISSALTAIYTAPDEYHREHYEELVSAAAIEEISSLQEDWLSHNRQRFNEEDFQDGLLDKLMTQWTVNVVFPEVQLLQKNAWLRIDSVEVEASDKSSDLFSFTVSLTIETAEGEQGSYKVTGNSRIDDEGKIKELRIIDNTSLSVAIAGLPE